jgi:carboxypeptidase PM20D1
MTRTPSRLFAASGAATLLLTTVIVARTAHYDSALLPVPATREVAVPDGAAERLAGALRIRTISSEDAGSVAASAFAELHRYLETTFPRVHRALRRDIVGGHSLLYTWTGSDDTARPILLAGHLDVTPVDPGTIGAWQHDPFGGRIADGFVWGRGAIDNKSGVIGALEAVEMLLSEGVRPSRTVYLAFGHDEEVGGSNGARAIAERLSADGVELELVLDEGGVIADGVLPGVARPVALVGVAEKGFVTLELVVRTAGGHSSLPPRDTAVGILAAAVARLDAQPMQARLEGPTAQLFDRVGPEMPYGPRAVLANLWLTRPLVLRALGRDPATNAMARTTTAPTIFQAGTKDNVLPAEARAVVNVRILPGDSIETVLDHVTAAVGDDRVTIRTAGRFSAEPSGVSHTDSDGYRTLERAIRQVVPDVLVAPALVVVATDARYYAPLGRNVFRFLPLRLARADLARMHGTNERIGVREYETAIRIYRQLLLDAAGP